MASQLRLRVLLPVAVLGVLGLGVGAFAFGKPAQGADADAVAANLANRPAATTTAPASNTTTNPGPPRPRLSPLERELKQHRVVVVLFYAPGSDYDTIQTREARAGALAANAGFLAVDVSKEKRLSKLATEYAVRGAPAVLVFARGPRVAARIQGYADRATVAQAAQNARS